MLRDSIDVDGRTRTYTVVGGPSKNLVLVFHGSKQTGPKHRDFTGAIFDTLPAVVVYLDGYRGNWNDARRESGFPARVENVDDVAFTRAVVARLAVSHGIDPARVFGVGYSNGGQMVMRLAHETPGLLAGATVIAATMPEPDSFLLASAPPGPLPVLLIHGTKDPIVGYAGGEMPWLTRTVFKVGGRSLSMPATAAYFAARNGITTSPVSTRRPGTAIETTEYRAQGHEPVALHTVHGGGHTVPGPRRAPAAFIVGRTNQDVNTAELITEFFQLMP
ncbi:alpha/beta hydrolase family esterase [Actinoplanes sp. HUAS TT8]|uniref:alpha/beta hydrolase family esterase n=1 Tax=Actinoplanes sp. HUAS TT8 TaxID=3447453 RepID=UPI003F52051C